MVDAILFGILTGFLLSFGFGSVFFALMQDSLDFGYRAGIKIAIGVIIGDVLLVVIALLGTSALPKIPDFETYIRIFGAFLLFGLGILQFRPKKMPIKIQRSRKFTLAYFISKGFLLNIVNPMNLFSWVILSSTLKSYRYTFNQEIVFFGVCIAMIFLTESLIAFFAHRAKRYFSAKVIQRINWFTGCVFIGIGLKLLYDIT